MKEIYVLVLREPYEGDCIFGVYSTKEKALEACSEVQNSCYPNNYQVLQTILDEKPNWNAAIALKYLNDSNNERNYD